MSSHPDRFYLDNPVTIVVVTRPVQPFSYRSSLALHFALHHVARTMLPAIFLCRQDGIEQSVPLLPHLYDGNDPSLHLLHIK